MPLLSPIGRLGRSIAARSPVTLPRVIPRSRTGQFALGAGAVRCVLNA